MMAQAAQLKGGFHPRTFNVMVHYDGGAPSKLFSAVTARHVDDILAELEKRMEGARIIAAEVYNEFTDAYQTLNPSDFPHLPSNLELDVRVTRPGDFLSAADDWTKGDGGRRFGQRAADRFSSSAAPPVASSSMAAAEVDLKRLIVDKVRVLFLPYFNRQQITKAEMAEACSVLLHRFVSSRGIDDTSLQSTRRDLTLSESDAIRMMCYEYTMEMGFDKRETGHQHSAAAYSGRNGRNGYGYDDDSVVGPTAPPQYLPQGANVRGLAAPFLHTAQRATTPHRQRSFGTASPAPGSSRTSRPQASVGFGSAVSRFGGASSPAPGHHRSRLRQHDEDARASQSFRNEPETGFYFPTARAAHRATSPTHNAIVGRPGRFDSPPPPPGGYAVNPARFAAADYRAGSAYSAGDAPVPAAGVGVVSVSYTVAGTFPDPPERAPPVAAVGDDLRAALSPPAIVSGDDDIVITVALHAPSAVTLCWWLAYGPSNIVLNLDKLYSNGLVTTFQISENAVVLTVKGGTLVPGWEYAVHVDVNEIATARVTGAQIQFTVPSTQTGLPPGSRVTNNGGMLAPPGIGSATDFNARRDDYLKAKKMGGTNGWFGLGYTADAEPGPLRNDDSPPRGAPSYGQVQDSRGAPSSAPTAPGTVTSIERFGTNAAGTQAGSAAPKSPAARTQNGAAAASTPAAATIDAAAQGEAASSAKQPPPKSSGTFQEQLRDFFVHQVEPLYYLSANPSISEQSFKAAVRGVSKQYWFSQPAATQLSEDMKRQIVKDVKVAVAMARQDHTVVR
jgi:hypothetical protein